MFHKDIGENFKKQVMKDATEQSAELKISKQQNLKFNQLLYM